MIMARGMGCATRGGGAVMSGGGSGKSISKTSKTTGPVMMAKGGAVNQHKRMAMGQKVNGYRKGGMCG